MPRPVLAPFALLALGVTPLAASAQSCPTCGPRLSNSYAAYTDVECDRHGIKQNPRFESQYIKQFCQPHISPSSCFGFFKTQVTPWGRACPNYAADGQAMPGCAAPAPAGVAGPVLAPVTLPAPNSAPVAGAKPAERPAPDPAPVPKVAPPEDSPRPPSGPLVPPVNPPSKLDPLSRGELPPLPEPEIPVAPVPARQVPAVPVSLPRF